MLKLSGSDVIVGGSFQTLGGGAVSRNRVAKIDKDDGTDVDPWDPNVDNTVRVILVSGSDVYLAGYFQFIGPDYRYDFAKVDSSGSATPLDIDVNSEVKSIGAYGTDVIVGGYFTTIGGKIRDRLAMFDAGGNVSSWNPGADSSVNVIAVSGTTVVAGGDFSRLGSGDDQVAMGKLAVFKDAETPSNTSPPSVTGTAALNGTLSCSTGSWTAGDANLISSYAYQWVRNRQCDLRRHLECACGHLVRLGCESELQCNGGELRRLGQLHQRSSHRKRLGQYASRQLTGHRLGNRDAKVFHQASQQKPEEGYQQWQGESQGFREHGRHGQREAPLSQHQAKPCCTQGYVYKGWFKERHSKAEKEVQEVSEAAAEAEEAARTH